MSAIMKISPQGQIKIPNKIMDLLGIAKGDYVEVDVKDNDIIFRSDPE
jgi:AbrB family looped-hinge helix DNA binding protein